jgi:hypothetical protein
MYLTELSERLKKKHKYNSPPGTCFIIYEIYKHSEKNDSGQIPTFIKIEPEIVKKKKFVL